MRTALPGPTALTHSSTTTYTCEASGRTIEQVAPQTTKTAELMSQGKPSVPSPSTERPDARRDLFVASFTLLFFELACIRWFGSMVIFLTFFTNLVLLASFIGMSIGCLAADAKRDYSRHTLLYVLAGVAFGWATLSAYIAFENLNVDVGGQASPQQIFFGTEYRAGDPSKIAVPIELIAGFFFILIALPFVGLGQRLGRALNAVPNRLAGYSIDIAGSVAGIALFGVLSFLQTPPVVWISVSVGCILYLTRDSWRGPRRRFTMVTAAALVVTAFVAGLPFGNQITYWSPYYKIDFDAHLRHITTNNISHQQMVPVANGGGSYCLPHLLHRDSGGKPFEDVLIIGAGSGNDVQAARYFDAKQIDGVEIDPIIRRIGKQNHPDHPYDDPRVMIYNDDGRSFLKRTTKQYDLIVYALVDSLVLHSGYSSLRLESYLFTQEAMNDIKARLKPGGMFAMYNFYRQGWVVARLEEMAKKTFGDEPIIISLPYRDTMRLTDNQGDSFTFVLAGDTKTIKESFAKSERFWLNTVPSVNKAMTTSAFSPKPPADDKGEWLPIAPAHLDTSWPAAEGRTPLDYLPSDDWPFLYLREAVIPSLNLRGMGLLALLSLGMLFTIAPWREGFGAAPAGYKFNGRMFFLGAGFMLLETKGVVHMALLFGSTWYVNSIVFGAVLVMILLANLFVHLVKPRSTAAYYVLLIVSLLVGVLVPMNVFLGLPGVLKVVASCAVTFMPIFFAGVVFATTFRDTTQPGLDFGCNIAGVMLGGLCENLSLIMGFSNLLGVAILFYLLSAVLQPRARVTTTAG